MENTEQKTVNKIFVIYEKKSPPRFGTYLAMSQLGTPCERNLWFDFHWCFKEQKPGRIHRLMERGLREEPVVIQNLMDAGVQGMVTHDSKGKQIFIKGEGMLRHLCGALDIEATEGLLEFPGIPTVVDIKSAKGTKFKAMVLGGVATEHPEYWDQLQLYMGYRGIKLGCILLVCKDTDDMYIEYREFSQERFELLQKRAVAIIGLPRPPRKRFEGKAFSSPCRFCKKYDLCNGLVAPLVNCRTCRFSKPVNTGYWECFKPEGHPGKIDKGLMEVGCDQHQFIPELFPALQTVLVADDGVEYCHTKTKITYVNGVGNMTSAELAEAVNSG